MGRNFRGMGSFDAGWDFPRRGISQREILHVKCHAVSGRLAGGMEGAMADHHAAVTFCQPCHRVRFLFHKLPAPRCGWGGSPASGIRGAFALPGEVGGAMGEGCRTKKFKELRNRFALRMGRQWKSPSVQALAYHPRGRTRSAPPWVPVTAVFVSRITFLSCSHG
jgi:hypothetical protein